MQELIVELQVVSDLGRPIFQDLPQWREVGDLEDVYDESLFGGGELEQAYSTVAGGEGGGLPPP